MQIHRFDEDSMIPTVADGAGYRFGSLLAEGAQVRVDVLRVAGGGAVPRSACGARRLCCVVGGRGWAEGGDGRRREVNVGDAACWEPGEEHEVGSTAGLTAVWLEGTFEVVARSVLREIVVVDHDPAWADCFEQLRAFVWPAVADLALRVDHVGSTAVPGLAAKPVIDMDVVVGSDETIGPAVERIVALGYRHLGELGVTGRQAFRCEVGTELPDHHLYLVVEDSRAHLDHCLLRDLLREDAAARRRYGELKRRNAELADGDIDAYTSAKAALVAELLTRARAERGLEPVEYWLPDT